MFGGEASDKFVKVLSGGEKTRLAMLRLLLEPVNLLILDEPTNHLDMKTKDVLKQAVKDFNGTVIVVSHDREFLDGLVDKVYEFGGGQVRECLGGIYEFLEKKKIDNLNELELSKSPTAQSVTSNSKTDADARSKVADKPKLNYAEQREREKMIRRAEKKVKDAEARVAEYESKLQNIVERISAGESDPEIFKQHEQANKELENEMSAWELAVLELEELK